MINGFYSASLGTKVAQGQLEIGANNVANASTTGFKSQSANFTDTLYSVVEEGSRGSGVRISEAVTDFSAGLPEYTGNLYDFSISGDGFFAVQSSGGKVLYTRNGFFRPVTDGGKTFLADASGNRVLDKNKKPIETDTNSTVLPAVFVFANPYALHHVGDSNFTADEFSGEGTPEKTGETVKRGYLEASNTDFVAEMTKLIQAQRAYQLNAKMLQTADEAEQTTNNLR